MNGTNCDLFTYNQSRSYLNHLVSRGLALLGLNVAHCGKNSATELILDTVRSLITRCIFDRCY
jgi:hypothetical protein